MSKIKIISLVLLLIILTITYKYFIFDASRLVRTGSINSILQLSRKNYKVQNKINGVEFIFNEDTYEFDFPTCSFHLIIDTLFSKKFTKLNFSSPNMQLKYLMVNRNTLMNKNIPFNEDSLQNILQRHPSKYSGFSIQFTYKYKPKGDFPLYINYIYQDKSYTDSVYFNYNKVIFNSNPYNVFMYSNYVDDEFK